MISNTTPGTKGITEKNFQLRFVFRLSLSNVKYVTLNSEVITMENDDTGLRVNPPLQPRMLRSWQSDGNSY